MKIFIVFISVFLLLTSIAYADIRGTNLSATDKRYLSKISDDASSYELRVSNLSADSISADAISTDVFWLLGYKFPTDTPNDNDVIKFDSALGRFNLEADATGAGSGSGIPGLGNQYEMTYWGNTDASISGDPAFTINPTTNQIITTRILTSGTKGFSLNQISDDVNDARANRVSQDTIEDYVSGDTIRNYVSGDVVKTVLEGVAGPIAITPAVGYQNVTISIQSADTSTAGYVSAANWNTWTNDRVSRDAVLATLVVGAVDNTEIGYLNGVTSAIQTQLSNRVSTDAVLASLVVGAVDNTEIGYLNGVTSAIQTQFSNRVSTDAVLNTLRTYGATTLPNFVSTDAVLNTLAVGSVSNTEIGYLDGVTSAIQTQLNNRVSQDAILTTLAVGNVSNTELGYLDGVTSAIQTQFSNRVSGDVVKSIAEGVAGPLVITPSAGYQYPTISIQSADTSGTDGYLKSAHYSIISNDMSDVKTYQKSITLIEPDQIATISKDVLMFPVDAYNFPGGITITKVGLASNTVTTTSYALEEWTSADIATTTTASIDVIYLTGSAESTDTGILDNSVAAGSWVVAEIDNVDIPMANITIWFRKK